MSKGALQAPGQERCSCLPSSTASMKHTGTWVCSCAASASSYEKCAHVLVSVEAGTALAAWRSMQLPCTGMQDIVVKPTGPAICFTPGLLHLAPPTRGVKHTEAQAVAEELLGSCPRLHQQAGHPQI